MGDCHSSDPGSNPGPGAYTSLRVPTSANIDNILINLETGSSSIIQQKENNNQYSDKYKVVKFIQDMYLQDGSHCFGM
jgi:hypothetical protein